MRFFCDPSEGACLGTCLHGPRKAATSNVPPPRPSFLQGIRDTGTTSVSKDTQFIIPLLSNGPNNQVMQLKWALALARMLGR